MCESFQTSKACGRCNAFRKEHQLSGWRCDRCNFDVQILIKTGSLAVSNCIRYIYLRRVMGKKQLERIHQLSPERFNIVSQRLRFPDIVNVDTTAVGKAFNKRRADPSGPSGSSDSKKRKAQLLRSLEGTQGE